MTTSVLTIHQRRAGWLARVGDYLELTKPRISLLVLMTVGVAGFVARWGQPDIWALFHVLVGTALVAASASTLNQWLELSSDQLMKRTAERPLPSGRLSGAESLGFSAITILLGTWYLVQTVGWLSASLGMLTWILYVLVYTPLKARTPWNTLVGAIAGALPVLIGWTAVGGRLDVRAISLFFIVFLWQFPHFMAIAWLYRRQYEVAGMKMITVVDDSGQRAGVQAVLGAMALLLVSLIPGMFAPPSSMYIVGAFALGFAQLVCAGLFLANRDDFTARRLLRASLVYLPCLLLLLTISPLA